jgi:TalC/MipB family fructose-6-phosphate aldolase
MALYIDCAYLDDITRVAQTIPLAGVTTNPTLLLDAYQRGQKLRTLEVVDYLLASFNGTIFVQPSVLDEASCYQEAQTYISLSPERIIPKIPMTAIGLQVAQRLRLQGNHIAFTAVTTVSQAYVAAMTGADFIIPYFNRLERCGVDASQRIEQIATLFHTHQLPTRIMAASIKSSVEATKALLAHAHDLTVPPKVLLEMVSDPETEQAVERFEQDVKKLKAL